MSANHLSKGSVVPPYTGMLRIYSMRFCPYAQRTILVLNAKKIPYEVVNINLIEKPEWLTQKSPLGKVPALEVENNLTIYESLVTADYLDDKYPEPRLVSSDPLKKAQDKLIVENFGKVTISWYKGLYAKSGEIDPSVATTFIQGLEELQAEMMKRGSKFLNGSTPGMADYMVWPWFERIILLPKFCDHSFAIDQTKFKVLIDWMENMKKDPAVQGHYLEPDIHEKFLRTAIAGTPDYDMLLK